MTPIMKLVYTLATGLAILLFVNDTSAQTYSGGTYTAVRSGSWFAVPGPNFVWDVTGQPPSTCNNCHIIIADGQTVTMNSDITLSGNSLLSVGTDASSTTTLNIPFSSNIAPPTPFPVPSAYNRISLVYGDLASVAISNSNSSVNASTSGPYDGVFLGVPTPGGNSQFVYIQRLGPTAPFPNPTTPVFGPGSLSSIGVLPIQMSDFQAAPHENEVNLTWTTLLEINSDHFDIQHLTASGAWETIGQVKASGNSATTIEYSFTDDKAVPGANEYRIQSVDKDKKYKISEIKVVTLGALSVSLFPNPAADFVNVNLGKTPSGMQSIRLISQTGQVLVEKRQENLGGTIVPLAVSNYPQGNYLIIVTGADGSRRVSKLFISHL
jgi:hypothetical protein